MVDDIADLYDLALVLFAIGRFVRATGDRGAADLARRTVGWICANMRGPVAGFMNTLPVEPEPRQQNPHMHLLEASLSLFEDRLLGTDVTQEAEWRYRSAETRGYIGEAGLIADMIAREGRARKASTRLWPQTKALKAHAVMRRRGRLYAARSGRVWIIRCSCSLRIAPRAVGTSIFPP